MSIKSLNKFIATETLLPKLVDEGFQVSKALDDYPRIYQDASDVINVWVEIEEDSTKYCCSLNLEDLIDDYPNEVQDVLNSVGSFEASDDNMEVVLESEQYAEIVAAVKKFIYL